MKKLIFVIIPVFLIMAGISALFFTFILPNNNVVPAFEEGKVNLVIGGEQIESAESPKLVDEKILLPLGIVKKYIDPNIYWDDKSKKVTITTMDKVIRMKTDTLSAMVNNKPMNLKIPVSRENNVVYIPIEFLSDLYNIKIEYLKENSVIIIDKKIPEYQAVEVVNFKAVIRKGHKRQFPIIKKLDSQQINENNTLRVFGEIGEWYKVRTHEGAIGYIEKRFVQVKTVKVNEPTKLENPSKVWKPEKGKINLAWEMMFSGTPDLKGRKKIVGLDVVSPTWFQVGDAKGNLINRADPKYIDWAHKNGYKVWALFSNGFDDPQMSKTILNNTDIRENMIRQLLAYANLYKIDGINIDFENINKEDRDALTQFVREMTPLLRAQGLTVSMDVSVPDGSDNWSKCFDRKALGQVVDYIILMAYDQHWSTSPKAGSVAELGWIEENLMKTLKEVSAEKLILGLPYYTRMWKEEKDDKGKARVSSPGTLSMSNSAKKLKQENVKPVWDDKSGQFYSEFKKDKAVYKIWLEDKSSVNLRTALALKYNLAGGAAWSMNDAAPEIWELLNQNLKILGSYKNWEEKNSNIKPAFSLLEADKQLK